ncbi:hypothetical protein H9Q69_005189 [Fusarium xylarioides]|nr:hypothetical protein H9Q70_005078 [Fusarium xylarioides]KAG5795763.1 hypothetical protein H9Q69_005189 [Fusarium xylarioides]KAG5807231.1 hypothetical protein H9Q71_008199 [Fusarium xylarioides]KAG5823814.1 hypothetical protein H9Q74_006080 [Fusarium xylarioides]
MEFTTHERRERPSRAAAPKSFKDPESDSDEPIVPRFRSVSSARSRSIHVKDETAHSSPDPAVETSPLPTLNQSAVLKKRSSSDEEADSPNKKVRKIVLKTNKSATASNNAATPRPVTPDLPHVEDSPSDDLSSIRSLHEGLESVQKRISATLRKTEFAVELDAAKKKIASLERQLLEASSPDDSTSKLKQCEKELAAAMKRNNRLLNDNVDLTRNLKDTQVYANDRQAYADSLRVEIATMLKERDPNFNDAFKVPDDEVVRAWDGIRYDIFTFVAQVLTVKPFRRQAPRGADHSVVEELKKEQKKDSNLAEFYFEQYIWKCLVRYIFQGEAATFGGPAGRVFQLFCLDISKIDCESMPELSRVKAHTANLLNKQFDENNQKEAKGIVDRMKNDLAIFMGSDQEHKAEERLKSIVSKAVMLNSYFLKSRAFFVTDWDIDDESDNFDDLIIRHRSGIEGGEPVVGIQISPRLSKIGNADGEFFGSTAMVIYKPIVTLNYE